MFNRFGGLNMKRLKDIINILKRNDIQLVESYIENISRSNKKQLLLDFAIHNNSKCKTDPSANFYGNASNIKKLEERLITDIEDVILLRFNKGQTNDLYEKNKLDAISFLLLAHYYMQNDLLSEAYLKFRRVRKIIEKYDFPLLELIYQQLWCNYLECQENNNLENELEKLSRKVSEYKYLNHLKIKRERKLLINEEDIEVPKNIDGSQFYIVCFRRLTEIDRLIEKNAIKEAEDKAKSLLADFTTNYVSIPIDIIIDAWLQMVKINFLLQKYASNKSILTRIKAMSLKSAALKNKYFALNFINNFRLGEYEMCRCILKNVNANYRNWTPRSGNNFIQWRYFDICLLFMRKEYHKVLECIKSLPVEESKLHERYINIKIIELYTLALLNDEDILHTKILSLERILEKSGDCKYHKYSTLITKVEKMSIGEMNVAPGKIKKDDFSDNKIFELIPFEYFVNEYFKCKNNVQIAVLQ